MSEPSSSSSGQQPSASTSSLGPLSPTLPSNPSPLRNGHLPASAPSSATNGKGLDNVGGSMSSHPQQPVSLYDNMPLDRSEVIRLTLQTLKDCGYSESAVALERESGYLLESSPVAELRAAVEGGRWDESKALVETVGTISDEAAVEAKFLVTEQKYLEMLETSQTKKALLVLRSELAPLNVDPSRLNLLSSYMLCSSPEDLRARSSWDGASGSSRRVLLERLQSTLSPENVIPPRRLATLLTQALTLQQETTPYFVLPPSSASLLHDQTGRRADFPLENTQKLTSHTDEVWNIVWSWDGKLLASAGRDKKAFVWTVGSDPSSSSGPSTSAVQVAQLNGHSDEVMNLAFSPDDLILLTTAEGQIKMWDVTTWNCFQTLSKHADAVSSVRWLPDGQSFFSSGDDGCMYHWHRTGTLLHPDPLDLHPLRLYDFDFTPDQKYLIGAASYAREPFIPSNPGAQGRGEGGGYKDVKGEIVMYEVEGMDKINTLPASLTGEITSFRLSRDGKTAIININPDEIQIWSFETLFSPRLVQRLHGHSQRQFYIRSSFGGPAENFVISGSEDAKLYVYHRHSGAVLEVLEGHGPGSVNSVAWRPSASGPPMIASCGDDKQILLWEPPKPASSL